MNNILKINIQNITSIKVLYKTKCYWHTYKTQLKILGIEFRKEGWYDWDEYVSMNPTTNNNKYIEGWCVYWKPHIECRMTDRSTWIKYFEYQKDLDRYLKTKIYPNMNMIDIQTD